MNIIGKSIPRVDAYDKVTGRAKFTDDLAPADCLVARIFHSTIANGKVISIDTSRAEELPGVIKVVTYEDVPLHSYPSPGHPWSIDPTHQDISDRRLLTDRVRYYGDDIAAVIATDDCIAAQALKLIQVEYEEYPMTLDPEVSLTMTDPPIHETYPNNILKQTSYEFGDVDAFMEQSDQIIEGTYTTPIVKHCHLELPVSYAYMERGRLVVTTSTQIPHIVKRVIGQSLGIPWGDIRVIKPYVGGGFGNKQDVLYEPLNAFLTMQVGGRPVKLELTREECFVNTRTRHALQYKLKMGVTKDGRILAKDMNGISNQGAYASHGHAIIANGSTAWRHLYDVKNVRANVRTIYTNAPTAGAMRGYGIPQFVWAMECHMDDAARALQIDPLDFRLKNIYQGYFKDPVLTPIAAHSNGVEACMIKGADAIHWYEKRREYQNQTGPVRRGVGMAIFSYKTGVWPISLEIAGARMILVQDGTIQLQIGATEIGQGADTVFIQMAAETLQMDPSRIRLQSIQDTDVVPFDTGAYGSRQSYVTGNAVKACAEKMRDNILDFARTLLNSSVTELELKDGYIYEDGAPVLPLLAVAMESYYSYAHSSAITAEVSLQTKTNTIAFGACFAEVEVDMPLGKVRILNLIQVHDSGQILNPQLAEMQVHGGMSMGIGFGLSEQMLFDDKTGRPLNANLLDYKVGTFMDAPDLNVDFVKTTDPSAPYGNKALGEPPTIPTAPAIRNAVLHATGVSFFENPLTPQRLVDAFLAAGLI